MPYIPREGDRIRLTHMQDEPDPLPIGSEGVVTHASWVNLNQGYVQVGVKWDNGRTLGLVCPPDQYDEC